MHQQQMNLDPVASAAARDAGIERVEGNNVAWIEHVMATLRSYLRTHAGYTTEEFRAWWEQAGGDPPKHVNAWGRVAQLAEKAGLIRFDRFDTAKNVAARARLIRCYA